MQICYSPSMALWWASTDPSEPLWFYCDLNSSRIFIFSANPWTGSGFWLCCGSGSGFPNWCGSIGSGSGSASLAAVKGQITRLINFIGLFHDPFERNLTFASKFCMVFLHSIRHILLGWKNFDILYCMNEYVCFYLKLCSNYFRVSQNLLKFKKMLLHLFSMN